jgi:hypothetical protein
VNTLPKTLFVGCDVSSQNNTVRLMDEEGKEMGYPTFPNTLPRAKALESQLLQLIKGKGFSTLKIATEATSFLDLHLVDFLASSQVLAPFNPSIYQFNPKLVRNFKKAYSDKEKTDKIDAFVITDRLRFGRLPEPYESHRPYLPLRRLTRYRFHIEGHQHRESLFPNTPVPQVLRICCREPFASLRSCLLAVITEFSPDELVPICPFRAENAFSSRNVSDRWKTVSVNPASVSCSRNSQMVFASRTVSPSERPRNHINDRRSRI